MYTREAILDIHDRSHRSLAKLIDHCRALDDEQLNRELDGFGYPTVRSQIHHIISAQRYWLSVIEDRMNADENEDAYRSADELEAFRAEIHSATETYIRSTPEDQLSARRDFVVWGGDRRPLIPAQVILRTQTHIYHHMGQVTAMCRLLAHPTPPGMDFPLTQ